MEFEQNKQPEAGIDDMTRLAASTRQLTISPIHESVAVEQTNAVNLDVAHQGAIPGESETTVAQASDSISEKAAAKKNHYLAMSISVGVMVAMSAIVFIGFTANR